MESGMPTWEAHTHPPLQVSDSNIDLTPHRYSTVAGPVAIQEGQGAWPYNATQQQHSLSAHPVSISYPYQAQSYSDDKVTETNFGPRRSLSTDPDLSNFQYSAPLPSSSDLIPTSQPHCMQDSSSNMTFQEHAGHGFGFPQDCLPSMPWLPTQDEFRQDSGYAGDDSCNHTPLHQSTPFSQVDPSFATTFTQSPMNDYDGAIGHEDVHGMAQSWQPGPQYEFNEAVCGRLNQSYASLIFTCLLQAPDHSRKLKEIYSWIEEHSNKASDDPGSRGWQNSVRHNLSMNKAFLKPTEAEGGKKLGSWRLAPWAVLEGGVNPTSSHRTKSTKNKSARKGAPAPQRASAGAKGGQATRDRTKKEGKLRQRIMPQRFAGPRRVMPYPGMYTPESSSSDALTPASTVSPLSTWQSPAPDGLPSYNGTWDTDDFDFGNGFDHRLPTSEPMLAHDQSLRPEDQQGVVSDDLGSLQLPSSSPHCDFYNSCHEDLSGFPTMSELGFDGGEGLQGMLERQLDEQAPLFVY